MVNGEAPFDLLILLDALLHIGMNEVSASFLIDLREVFLPKQTYDSRELDVDPLIKLTPIEGKKEIIKKQVNPYSKKSIEDIMFLIENNFISGSRNNGTWVLKLNSDDYKDKISFMLSMDENYKILHRKVIDYGFYCQRNFFKIPQFTKKLSKRSVKYGQIHYSYPFNNSNWNKFIISSLEKIIKIPLKNIRDLYNDYSLYSNINYSYRYENYNDYIKRIYSSKNVKNKKVIISGKCSFITNALNKTVIHIIGESTAIVYVKDLKIDYELLKEKALTIIGIPHIHNGTPVVIALKIIEKMPVNKNHYEQVFN